MVAVSAIASFACIEIFPADIILETFRYFLPFRICINFFLFRFIFIFFFCIYLSFFIIIYIFFAALECRRP